MIISFRKLKCDEHTVYIFDKGYNDYKAFAHFTDKNTGFVTRIKDNAKYEVTQINLIQNTFTVVFCLMKSLRLILLMELKTKLKLRKNKVL
jgi:hypothetical protein